MRWLGARCQAGYYSAPNNSDRKFETVDEEARSRHDGKNGDNTVDPTTGATTVGGIDSGVADRIAELRDGPGATSPSWHWKWASE